RRRMRLVEVAPVPPLPLLDLLTYRVPDGLACRIEPGMRVRVPLGRQVRTGVVAGFAEAPPPGELRSILDVLDTDPFLPPDLLELCRWTARYYLTTLAEVIGAIVPAAVPVPARAAAYRALAARPDGVLTIAGARAAGVGTAALRALIAAGLATAATRQAAPAPPTAVPSRDLRPTLTPAQRAAADAIGAALDA